ncbi:hypothetical protein B0H12DRAFT_1239143 [Mycena haematopus]|nr:hypothetical protein B0H12DRAFT_1239143 [Mycena haematopus]
MWALQRSDALFVPLIETYFLRSSGRRMLVDSLFCGRETARLRLSKYPAVTAGPASLNVVEPTEQVNSAFSTDWASIICTPLSAPRLCLLPAFLALSVVSCIGYGTTLRGFGAGLVPGIQPLPEALGTSPRRDGTTAVSHVVHRPARRSRNVEEVQKANGRGIRMKAETTSMSPMWMSCAAE